MIRQAAFTGNARLLKGGLHCHTTRSDGRGTPEEVIRLHAEHGYDFLAITDHRKYNYRNFAPETGITILPGMEMDRNLRSEYGYRCFHTVCVGPGKEQGNAYEQDQVFESGFVKDQYEYQAVLDEIHAAVKEAYGENYIPSAAFDEQGMKELFGINSDLYDSFIAEGPMISVHVDTFVAVKAKEGKGEEVAQHLNDYRDSQLNGAMQYPMNLPEIEASQVVRHGDYVFFVMLGTPSEEAALESAKENTQIAIDIIDGFFAS